MSERQRRDVIKALRDGVVPERGLHLLATGVEPFAEVIDGELKDVAAGRSHFKAVRAPYGGGKTFFSRWLQARALEQGFAVSEVSISAADTPLHKLETVYRRGLERLSTPTTHGRALRGIVEGWLFNLEDELIEEGKLGEDAEPEEVARVQGAEIEARFTALSQRCPEFSSALRAYARAQVEERGEVCDGLLAWLSGSPKIAASIKKEAGLKGDVDSRMALNFLAGIVEILRKSGHKGLVWVLDEVETIHQLRRDLRDKSLQSLRQLIDEMHAGHLPNVYLLITGTPQFFESARGVQALEPLAQRLEVHFGEDPSFDNRRAVQVRLTAFTEERLLEVGRKVRDLYPAEDEERAQRLQQRAGDGFLRGLVQNVCGALGGKVGVSPRIFLKKLVDVLDRIHDHPEFDPRQHYALTLEEGELNDHERGAAPDLDEIDLELPEA